MHSSRIKHLFCVLITYNLFVSVKSAPTNYTEKLKKLVNNYGYPFEIHHVTTKDGYILDLHRIPNGLRNNDSDDGKPAVFIKHGFGDCSAIFLVSGPNLSLAFSLADKGYDIWLGNSRGNIYSRRHKIYPETNKNFWNFSWHEIGLNDDTAMIDYILEKTQQKKLFHVCHSEGCAQFFVMTSLQPNYNNKIHLSVNLAPAILYGETSLRTRIFLTIFYLLKDHYARMGYTKVVDRTFLLNTITYIFCGGGSILKPFCYFTMCLIAGFDWFETDWSLLPRFFQYHPAGASIKEIIHYASLLFYPGTFRQFDYGKSKNMKIYNSSIPPEYPLENVSVPVAFFYGDCDNLVSVKDVKRFLKMIPNVIEENLLKNYNHASYMLHQSARKLVYEKVLKLFEDSRNI